MKDESTDLTITVSSPAFGTNGMIPIEYSAEGDNIAPPLRWTNIPEGTQSIAVIVEDPDAPQRVFTHWIITGIAPHVSEIPAGGVLPAGAVDGKNDRGGLGWYGPNPPNGRHRYYFKVFALDINLDKGGLSKQELYSAMKGHVLAQGQLIGTYEKKIGFGRGPRANVIGGTGSHARRQRRR